MGGVAGVVMIFCSSNLQHREGATLAALGAIVSGEILKPAIVDVAVGGDGDGVIGGRVRCAIGTPGSS